MTWLPVHQVQYPPIHPTAIPPAVATTLLIDATGEKVGFIGPVWNKDRATKNITKVGFRFGAVTKAGGSGLTLSLQTVDLANGPPGRPDETQDQTVAIANGDAAFASNTWYQTAALSAARTVAFGEMLGIVIEYDGGGRLGADSVVISASSSIGSGAKSNVGSPALKTGGTWAHADVVSNVVLEFDDGTFGTLLDSYPYSGITTTAYNSGSAADEFALEFTVPVQMKVDGAWVPVIAAAGADFDVVLYQGTTALATASVDANTVVGNTVARPSRVLFAEQVLSPGNTYRLAVKPTTANNVTIYDFVVSDANHLQAWPLGTSAYLATRVDAGDWTPVATRRPFLGLYLSAVLAGFPRSRAHLGM